MQSNKGSAHKIIQNIDKALKETKNFKKLKKGLNKISKKKPFLNPRFMSQAVINLNIQAETTKNKSCKNIFKVDIK